MPAVFLSYASQDAGAARRLHAGLTEAGVEAWLDQGELQGGDAWDTKIRQQIRDCSLFIALISAQTEARREGYFRREWRLAAERTLDMADDRVFLVPVVIDGTPEATAAVPEAFRQAQWTRLPGGEPTPAFVRRVDQLLRSGGVVARSGSVAGPVERRGDPGVAPAPVVKEGPRWIRHPIAMVAVVVGLAVVLAAVLKRGGDGTSGVGERQAPSAVVTPASQGGVSETGGVAGEPVKQGTVAPTLAKVPEPPAPGPPPAGLEDLRELREGITRGVLAARASVARTFVGEPAVAEPGAQTSIAVLPFTSLSEDPENAFFADGVHEDVLTTLSRLRGLKVISRTSVLRFRDHKGSIRDVADQLGVTHVLEGSVRRAGARVRVTAQLIDAATDAHVWAETFDRDVTDVLRLQAELAQEIVRAMQGSLAAGIEVGAVPWAEVPDPEAYDLFLKGRGAHRDERRFDPEAMKQAAERLRAALELAPSYVPAWTELSLTELWLHWTGFDRSPERLRAAEEAAAEALRLDPAHPETRRARGELLYRAERRFDAALDEFRRLVRDLPNDADAWLTIGAIERRQGKWRRSMRSMERAAELDPLDLTVRTELASTRAALRDWPGVARLLEEIERIDPGNPRHALMRLAHELSATGDVKAFMESVADLPASVMETPEAKGLEFLGYAYQGDYEGIARYLTTYEIPAGAHPLVAIQVTFARAMADWKLKGRESLDRGALEAALAALGPWGETSGGLLIAASVKAMLGDEAEARRLADRAVEVDPVTVDAFSGARAAGANGRIAVLAMLNDADAVVEELRRWMNVPGAVDLTVLDLDPTFEAVRKDPRFAEVRATAQVPIRPQD